jgi:hypothetical protein
MTTAFWRTVALVLAALCIVQTWRGCTRAPSPSASVKVAAEYPATTPIGAGAVTVRSADRARPPALPSEATAGTARSFHGVKIPAWVTSLLPQPGENLRDYRDRMLPLARTVIAPQRARVARMRDDFATLDAHQRAELDGAVQEAASAIQDRVMHGILSGELRPATFKPMTGVAVARDVLDIVDRGNTRFVNSLTPDQRTRLASHRFDFADYLVFSARWEDALGVRDSAAAR